MMLNRHAPNSSDGLQRNPLGIHKSSIDANIIERNPLSYQFSRLNVVTVADLYPVIDNLLDVFLPDPCRSAHRVVLTKIHASSNYQHPKHVWIQIDQPMGCGLSTVERLPTAHDMLHLVCPGSRYFHSRRLRPTRRSITIGYKSVQQCVPW